MTKKRKRFDCVVTDDGITHALAPKSRNRTLYCFFLCKPTEQTRTFRRQRKKGLQPTCLGCLANV